MRLYINNAKWKTWVFLHDSANHTSHFANYCLKFIYKKLRRASDLPARFMVWIANTFFYLSATELMELDRNFPDIIEGE